ncbi:hypothetical protein GCM10008107_24860 [Psychrosphaera saromensis]|uniref:Uncharacterized protein n=1 Tax=Psychrosphaera saromensis TaxID=716813 RepID=A0A2S7UX29_9GAMM|nr:hypothetical protein [Psychrosphaera saromensis]PQJ54298.1 hypothetical protein BTO11_11955 [Psychrosphaera saromensis]GHB74461.1 hypothetical protein GCM10008107_24860 [Psychrosphaera saromensis]GLQ12599.1 hypothetical protein GCM10007917_00540 [Psychrosphaera saromensis]
MIKEYYNSISNYLMEVLNSDYIFLIILLTTSASIVYFIVITYIITQMDTRYFISKKVSANDSKKNHQLTLMRHAVNHTVFYMVKAAEIILGVILILCGLAMLVLPGQGIITLLIGLSLVPFPGKDKLERNLLGRKSVQSTLNWIRIKANKEPFVFD